MKHYSFLLEGHSYYTSKKFKKDLPELGFGLGVRSLMGGLAGLGVGEITGRIASRNETDPEKKKKIRNKHRLIGAGLGAGGFAGYGLYKDNKENLKFFRSGRNFTIKSYKESKAQYFEIKKKLALEQEKLNNALKRYKEIDDELYNNEKLTPYERNTMRSDLEDLKYDISDLRSDISRHEDDLRFFKQDIQRQRNEYNKYYR